jgi:hypothetical protein
MSTVASRTDRAHELQYPSTADARGSTRVNHLRRPYYFGPHDTPQSYVMFGLWKHLLLTEGEAAETKDLRPLVDEFLGKKPSPAEPESKARFIPSMVLSSVLLCSALLCAVAIFSSNRAPTVDDKVLTATEMDFIRGMRQENANLQHDLDLIQANDLVALTNKLVSAGAKHGPQKLHGSDK